MTPTTDVPALNVGVMGVTIAIDPEDHVTRSRLAAQWSRATVSELEAPVSGRVGADTGPTQSAHARDYAVATQVTLAALRATAGERYNLHAGGLADDDGRVLAVVAPSGTGKTTATRLLAERLGYVSDETVSITPDGVVYPHAKPLSVITDPTLPGRKEQLSPDALGLRPTPTCGRLARIVVLRRGVPHPRGLVRVPTLDGLLHLIEQSSSVVEARDPLLTLLSLVETAGGVWMLEYDEIDQHVEELEAFLASEVAVLDDPVAARHLGDPHAQLVDAAADTLQRLPWVDAIELHGEVLVLLPARAVKLDNLMATAWLELSVPRTLDELAVAAEAEHGAHPDARALVREAIAVMVEQHLVVWGALA